MQSRMLAAMAVAVVLAACGGGGGGDGAGEASSTSGTYDLAVSALPARPVVPGGTPMHYLRVANTGPGTATDVAITILLDAGQAPGTLRCGAAGGARCPATLGASMTVPSLPSGGHLTFVVPGAVVSSATDIPGGTMTVSAAGDSSATNNSARSTVMVVAPNSITLRGDPGDFIAGNQAHDYTQANAVMTVTGTGRQLAITVTGDQRWAANFVVPTSATRLQPGTYTNLTGYPFHDPAVGGLDWSGEGRGCNKLTGQFTIDSVTYAGDVLQAIDLSFEQHCEGRAPALHGRVHWTVYDDGVAPGPVTPPPAGLWEPTNITLPAGNVVYLVSDPGEFIGAGRSYLFTPADGPASVRSTGRELSVGIGGWSAMFSGMNAIPLLKPGYYGDIGRYPFHNPTRGALEWSTGGRSCSRVTGWFVVDEVTYVGTTLKSVDLRFEQHCEGRADALRGRVRWAP